MIEVEWLEEDHAVAGVKRGQHDVHKCLVGAGGDDHIVLRRGRRGAT